ncbi:MAG: hypothetical protein MJE77_10440 [Proteobacteria bacterium]|nr:hypothetical protein [Pseudomonadota bacterium]
MELGERYVINVEKEGHVPRSIIYVGDGATDLTVMLRKAQILAFKPDQSVDLEADRGTIISMAANALVDQNGVPARKPITAQVYTYDVQREEMVGNMEAVDDSGNVVMLESVGAVSVDLVGTDGEHYQLGPNQQATLSVMLPAGMDYSGPIPMWYYDMDQGRWIQEGEGRVVNGVAIGSVSHFSVWNFDVKRDDPACIRVVVPEALAPNPGDTVKARVEVGGDFPRTSNVELDRGDNVLFNLTPNTEVRIFIPAQSVIPLDIVNSGPPWGGTGVPPGDFSACHNPDDPTDSANPIVVLPDDLPGQIVGFVALQAHPDPEGATATASNNTDPDDADASADAVGQYKIEAKPETYRVMLDHPGYLAVEFPSEIVNPGRVRVLPCVQLLAGDLNKDNKVDTEDEEILLDNMGDKHPADYDGSGSVDGKDHAILVNNMGISGPLPATDDRVQCSSGSSVTKVAGGRDHTCALLSNKKVRCWGGNTHGQLGYGHTNRIGDDELLVFAGNVNVGGDVVDIVAGWYHTCALLQSGDVRCWGLNNYGQLGLSHRNSIGVIDVPANHPVVNVGGRVVEIAAGVNHTCARLDDGVIRCWGYNAHGQLGYGDGAEDVGDDEHPASKSPVDVGGTVVELSAGNGHTCARLENGAVRCWGHNSHGKLGNPTLAENIGDNEPPSAAPPVPVGASVRRISSANAHTCVITAANNVRCWGANDSGELGYGDRQSRGDNETPAQAGDVLLENLPVAELVTGSLYTCALLDNGQLRCWGENDNGELGLGHRSSTTTPAIVQIGGEIISSFDLGMDHICVVLASERVRCWGRNSDGQLGYGHTNDLGDSPAEMPSSLENVPFL